MESIDVGDRGFGCGFDCGDRGGIYCRISSFLIFVRLSGIIHIFSNIKTLNEETVPSLYPIYISARISR
jgi:hypothetical protein